MYVLKKFSEYDIRGRVYAVIYSLIIVHDSFEQGEETDCSILCAPDLLPVE